MGKIRNHTRIPIKDRGRVTHVVVEVSDSAGIHGLCFCVRKIGRHVRVQWEEGSLITGPVPLPEELKILLSDLTEHEIERTNGASLVRLFEDEDAAQKWCEERSNELMTDPIHKRPHRWLGLASGTRGGIVHVLKAQVGSTVQECRKITLFYCPPGTRLVIGAHQIKTVCEDLGIDRRSKSRVIVLSRGCLCLQWPHFMDNKPFASRSDRRRFLQIPRRAETEIDLNIGSIFVRSFGTRRDSLAWSLQRNGEIRDQFLRNRNVA
jgi:hypothetical protein